MYFVERPNWVNEDPMKMKTTSLIKKDTNVHSPENLVEKPWQNKYLLTRAR